MSTLSLHLDDYLRLRRALGFKLEREGRLLAQFVAFLEAAGTTTITSDLAITWAGQPAQPNPRALRLRVARKFAIYLLTIDPLTEIPPPDVFPYRKHRRVPYLWSQRDICRLLEETRTLRPPLRAATYQTLFGLLATTGMRMGEAIGLERDDLDLHAGVVTIRQAKFDRTRLVPLHPTVTDALGRYETERDRLCPTPRSPTFFVSSIGTALARTGVAIALRQLTTAMGIRTETVHPRTHDLRHSFAVETLIRWHRSGVDVNAAMPRLSTYLGHIAPADTYWYLTASPELMELAAARLDDCYGARP
jgi:integrase/recombinase XerD